MSEEFQITLEDLCKVKAELFVEFKTDSIPKIKNRIKEKFGSMNKFSKLLDINNGELSSRLAQKHKTNILLALKIAKSLELNLSDIVKKVTTRKRNGCLILTESFPIKSSEELASLVGHAFADGHIEKDTFSFTNKCDVLIKKVIRDVKKVGFKNVRPNRWFHHGTTIRFSQVVRAVVQLAGGPVGNKSIQPFKIPDWIKNGSKEIKQSFIQALFDDDGSIKLNRSITLSFSKIENLQNNLFEFLNDVNSMLKEFKIEGAKISKGETWISKTGVRTIPMILYFTSAKNFINFQKFINFLHPKKSARLSKIINDTKIIRLRVGEGKTKILGLLKDKPQTVKEIALTLSMTISTVQEHLICLENKNLIERINTCRPYIWMIKK